MKVITNAALAVFPATIESASIRTTGYEFLTLYAQNDVTVNSFTIQASPDDGVSWFPLSNPYTIATSSAVVAPALTGGAPRGIRFLIAGIPLVRVQVQGGVGAAVVNAWVYLE